MQLLEGFLTTNPSRKLSKLGVFPSTFLTFALCRRNYNDRYSVLRAVDYCFSVPDKYDLPLPRMVLQRRPQTVEKAQF